MKDWTLTVLGIVFAFLVVICGAAYLSRQGAPQSAHYEQEAWTGEYGGPRAPSEKQQRLSALAQQVAYHERCFMAGNLLPGQRVEDQPLRAIAIAENAHFSIEERGRQLVELDQTMTFRRAQPLIEQVMSGASR